MSVEAFVVGYDKINYHAAIAQGHDREMVLKIREKRIEDNILRYLGEYRLGVKFAEIFYRQETDSATGETYFASGEEGPIRNIFRRSIETKEKNGLSPKRDVAECLGFEKLEKQLVSSKEDLLFVWVSPPGPRSDGFGDYSFTYVGQKVKDPKTGEEKLRVIPYRNILSQEEHRAYLVGFDRQAENFKQDTDFLANPIVFSPKEDIKQPEDILIIVGEREKVSTDWFARLKKQVGQLIERYIELVKINASDAELTKVKYAIENYTIAIKNTLDNSVLRQDIDITINIWGSYAPPRAGGSCGSSNSSTLSKLHEEFNKWEYHTGDCVVCGVKNTDVGPCSICKQCEKKFDKEEWSNF